MKRNTTAPLILGGLAAAAFAFIYLRNKARAGQNLRFEPVDIAIDTARTRAAIFTRLFYTVKIRLVNDEPAAVVVNSVNLAATANGRPFGNLTSAERFTVPAKGSQVIALNTSIATLGAAGAILDYIRSRQPVEVTINGYVDTDLGRVTVEYNTSLGGGVNGRRAVNGPPKSKDDFEYINRTVKLYNGEWKPVYKKGGDLFYKDFKVPGLYVYMGKAKDKALQFTLYRPH